MPSINKHLIPTKAPGTIFDSFTGDDLSLNIRWLTATDPCYYETLNRPTVDLTVRQLVLAKALDNVQLQLGHQSLYPFLVQPQVTSGTTSLDVPISWIWDMQASLPKKWESLRLAKIKRISGTNEVTGNYDGMLRLIFTANVQSSSVEVAVLYADYHIDSSLTYQLGRLSFVSGAEETVAISPGESQTVAGFITFRTLDTDDPGVQQFLDLLAPPNDPPGTNGFYNTPTVYEIADTIGGGTGLDGDYSEDPVSHGTGLLTDNSWNPIPPVDSDTQAWVESLNYPFDANANRLSSAGVAIPVGLFSEFNIVAPAGDEPTGDTSGTFYPVWITRIERIGTSQDRLRFFFATYNVTDVEIGGTPITQAVEFATMDLLNSYTAGEVVEIAPLNNLYGQTGPNAAQWDQHFGRGHVVLSGVWDGTTTIITDFFDAFDNVVDNELEFSKSSTRISSFGVSRVPKYTPTKGQSHALLGSTSRLTNPVPPSSSNRYVTEADQGLGNKVDLESQPGISAHPSIERYGDTGALTHRIVRLVVDAANLGSDPNFYDEHILPRLTVLYGRPPQFGDCWFTGSRFMWFNGDTFQG